MISLRGVVACALLVLPVACKKAAKPDGVGRGSVAAAGAAVAPQALKATLAGTAIAPLYGVAQPDPARGNSHRLTFATRPLTCATFAAALAETRAGESFWIQTREALRPDGTTTWAYGGVAFADGGSSPSGLVAMPSYEVEAARSVGTLPAVVAHDASGGTFAVSGSFAVPICEPLPIPRLRDLADRKQDAVPIEAKGSTARATIAGKAFDVKGATAVVVGEGTWEVRLTAQPHGCADEVPGDLVVELRVGGAAPRLSLGGNWIAGSANVAPLEGSLTVDAKPGAAAVALTLAGEMAYTPADVAYQVALSGTVDAVVCAGR